MSSQSQQSVGEFFGEINLNIPAYQRAYSWDRKQVRELFEDVIYAMENYRDNNSYHYFGALVLEKGDKIKSYASQWQQYNVIDGQQRLISTTILIRVISDELNNLSKKAQETKNNEQFCSNIKEISTSIEEKYIKNKSIQKIDPEDISKKYYNKLIVEGEDPDKVVEKETPLVAHRIKNAIETVRQMILSETNELDIKKTLDFLDQFIQTLSNEFRLNIHYLSNIDEASRMFKIVNERGKPISAVDKIKSHLMYVTTEIEDIEPTFVSARINNAIEKISKYPNATDKDIENLMKTHFVIFTGERNNDWVTNYNKYAGNYRKSMSFVERLQEMPWYASPDRNAKELKIFIENYVESLNDIASSFAQWTFANQVRDDTELTQDIWSDLYVFHHSNKSTFSAFITALLYAFDDDPEELTKIIKEIRKPALMYSQVMNNSGLYKRKLQELSHKLFWYKWSDSDPTRYKNTVIHGREHILYDIPTTQRSVVDNIQSEIRDRNERSDIEKIFRQRLLEPSITDGKFTTGWGGVRKIKTIKILLYYYEKSLRTQTGKASLQSLQHWCNQVELEHIIPQNPRKGQQLIDHEMQVNKLGNFLVLAEKDNQNVSNKKYGHKKELYNNLNLKMTEHLPEKISGSAIDNRSEHIISSLLSYI